MKKRKLTRLSLDELAKTMSYLTPEDQKSYIGGYKEDCFWRCVNWLKNGDVSEAGAEKIANLYYAFSNHYFDVDATSAAKEYYSEHTALTPWSVARNVFELGATYSAFSMPTDKGYIAHVASEPGASYGHGVVITGENPDGSYQYFDPQQNKEGTITDRSLVTRWSPE